MTEISSNAPMMPPPDQDGFKKVKVPAEQKENKPPIFNEGFNSILNDPKNKELIADLLKRGLTLEQAKEHLRNLSNPNLDKILKDIENHKYRNEILNKFGLTESDFKVILDNLKNIKSNEPKMMSDEDVAKIIQVAKDRCEEHKQVAKDMSFGL
jgi:hypothetical protein